MKNQSLTLAKLRKLLLVTALVICPLLANSGFGQTATATLTSGGMTSISILGNQSFQLTLAVTTNFSSAGYSVWYQVSTNGIGLFQAVARVNNNAFLTDAITNDATAFGGMAGVLNQGPSGATNQFDLGYVFGSQNQPPGSGISLQTITFNTLNAAPGVYTIFLDNRSVMADDLFNDVSLGGGPMGNGPKFTITVIPEPTTVGLALLGGAALFVVARRKLRA